jgi:hypothetical protein
VNSQEENSKDFCTNYVQEFGLCVRMLDLGRIVPYSQKRSHSPVHPFLGGGGGGREEGKKTMLHCCLAAPPSPVTFRFPPAGQLVWFF